MFSHHTSQHTRPFVTILLALSLILITLWLSGGASLPAQALPIEISQSPSPLALNTVLTVTNANDDGPGSLRQAIADAANGDIINFDNDYSIYLSSTLEMTKQLTIDGDSHSITISGDSLNDGSRNVQVFAIDSTAVVTLSYLNIVSGTAFGGGGVSNAGNLTVRNCVFDSNISYGNGGGVYNSGMLTLAYSKFLRNAADTNGGGIYGYGILTLTNMVFMSNTSAFDGGGIFVDGGGQLTLQDSTLSGNISGSGGGISNISSLTLVNSTLAGNIATYGGGGLFNYGTLTATNSTFSGNLSQGSDQDLDGGGAIHQWGPSMAPPKALLKNVTFTGNDAPDVIGRDGFWIERGSLQLHNVLLVDNGTNNCTIKAGAVFTATADSMADDATCVGATAVPSTSLILGPLADNGGSTWTHALLPGSPAIDAGDDAKCPLTDQRGTARPQSAHCDIGAYEYQSTSISYTLNVTTTGIGSGVVSIDPSSPYYVAGTVVTLTAVPSPTSRFTGWSGDVMTTTNPLVLTMDGNKTITATFVTYRVYLPLAIK